MTFLPTESAEHFRAMLRGDESDSDLQPRWFALREQVAPFIGERAVTLFSYAISGAAGGSVCADYFRQVLTENGEDPDHPQVTEAEQLLIDWGRLIAADPTAIPVELTERVERTFNPELRALLVAFAAGVVAANLFAIVGEIQPDGAH